MMIASILLALACTSSPPDDTGRDSPSDTSGPEDTAPEDTGYAENRIKAVSFTCDSEDWTFTTWLWRRGYEVELEIVQDLGGAYGQEGPHHLAFEEKVGSVERWGIVLPWVSGNYQQDDVSTAMECDRLLWLGFRIYSDPDCVIWGSSDTLGYWATFQCDVRAPI